MDNSESGDERGVDKEATFDWREYLQSGVSWSGRNGKCGDVEMSPRAGMWTVKDGVVPIIPKCSFPGSTS